MNDALGLFLPVAELVLLAAAEVNLIVGELAAGEWLAVGRRRLQVGGMTYAVPEPIVGIGRDLLTERFRMEPRTLFKTSYCGSVRIQSGHLRNLVTRHRG